MVELRTLGTLSVRGPDGREIDALLAQPKRLALLVYLCLATPRGFHRRDTLLGIFWPESDEFHARAALRKALHMLRRTVGEGVVVARGEEEVGVDFRSISCDAIAFQDLSERGRLEESMALYAGDLLPGFFVDDVAEFERWLERERSRMRTLAARTAGRLTDKLESVGRVADAVVAARTALDLARTDERQLRRLLELLDRVGNRTGATAAYEEFVKQVAASAGVEPSVETQELIRHIRGRTAPSGITAPTGRGSSRLAAIVIAPSDGTQPAVGARTRGNLPWRLIAAGVGVATATTWLWLASHRGTAASRVDDNVITVAPFRLSADPSLSYLREGIVDLLAANLTGEGGLRATDPRATLAAWRRAGGERDEVTEQRARELARDLGAARVLLGSVVGSERRIVISAMVVDVGDSRRRTDIRVEDPADSLARLIDRLTAQILAGHRGGGARAAVSLADIPLPALRAYLDGQAAFRRARYNEATEHYLRALQIDSSFALAALSGMLSANWSVRVPEFRAAVTRVWKARDRLNVRDRALAMALAGRVGVTGYDGPRGTTAAQALWDSAARLAPDNADVWHELADETFHFGSFLMPVEDARKRAVAAFGRVLALDSSYASAYEHLFDAAVIDGDTARARWAATKYLSLDSLAEHRDYIRWRLAHAIGDSVAIRANRARIPAMTFHNASRIHGFATIEGIDAVDARAALATAAARAASPIDVLGVALREYWHLTNQGRLTAAREQMRRKPRHPLFPPDVTPDVLDVYESMYGDLDVAEGKRAARQVEAWLARHTGLADAPYRYTLGCWLAEWHMSRGDLASAERFRPVITASSHAAGFPHGVGGNATREGLCVALIDAWLAVARRQPDARLRLEHADSLLMGMLDVASVEGPVIVARLWETMGEPARALTAVRRRYYHWANTVAAAWIAREEGRLAALAGDREGAIRAYRRFLGMRPDPEERFRPEVERVKREVDRLVRL